MALGTVPETYEQRASAPASGGRYCERVGAAPILPPATDGNPGNPAPKADFSGFCVAKGWSVQTFKPDGSPTTVASDQVAKMSKPQAAASCE